MFDVTFYIPDYDDSQPWYWLPNDPDSEMPDRERERLFDDLCARIDAGEFDPTCEILI